MEYETLDVTKNNNIVTVALNRPEVHNAMNESLMKELTSCFKELSNDDTTRVITLTGNGKSFCAGADLHWMKRMVNFSKDENIKDSMLLLDLYETIYSCPKPVIGRINGHAFGGGVGLIAVCDITVTIPDKKFAFSEVHLGIIPAVISSYVAPRLSHATMRRLFLTGERFDSSYAHQIGLLDYIVPTEELDSKIATIVELLWSSGPQAMAEVKNLLSHLRTDNPKEYQKFSVEKIAALRIAKEGQEGINAFLEKRKPTWRE